MWGWEACPEGVEIEKYLNLQLLLNLRWRILASFAM
jgi:hypothetical protein